MELPIGSPAIPRAFILLLAAACGIIVANIYYAQPLAGPIGQALGLNVGATGLIVTLTQIGYGLGLLFIVPLGDLVETRRLVLIAIALSAAALLLSATSAHPFPFLIASLLIGIGSTAVQILVPYAASLAPVHIRGRVVGQVMSGLLIGIMLSRPAASFVDDLWGWQAIFFVGAGLMVVIGGALAFSLPPRQPTSQQRYLALLASMAWLYRTTPILRRRALYQALLFGAFTTSGLRRRCCLPDLCFIFHSAGLLSLRWREWQAHWPRRLLDTLPTRATAVLPPALPWGPFLAVFC